MGIIVNGREYQQLNQMLDEKVRKLYDVNFIRFVSVDEEKKCSVICQYEKQGDFIYPFLSNEVNNNPYYGIHPQFDTKEILQAIKLGVFQNEEYLLEYLKKNRTLFSLHEHSHKYIDAVFAMVVMRMASRFGVVFNCSDKAWKVFENLCSGYKEELIEDITYKHLEEKSSLGNCIAFLGGLTNALITILKAHELVWWMDSESSELCLIHRSEGYDAKCFNIFYDGIKDIDVSNIVQLCYGSVYYSGVLPRVHHISKEISYSNPEVQTLKFKAERTTFATLDAFDNGNIVKHPLLIRYYEDLRIFFATEDEAQKKLFIDPNTLSNDGMISAINDYLNYSPNTHTLAVSGNITDIDGKLILAMRNSSSIDSGKYYCSVNGQSEFTDKNVRFYKESVFEDYPSLQADLNARNDFNNELDRETKAELNIDKLSSNLHSRPLITRWAVQFPTSEKALSADW